MEEIHPVWILYTNWKGETRWRKISPLSGLWSKGNQWHKEPQHLLMAYDLEDPTEAEGIYQVKGFAQKDIHKWQYEEPTEDQKKFRYADRMFS